MQQDHSNNSLCCSSCSQSAFSKCNTPNNLTKTAQLLDQYSAKSVCCHLNVLNANILKVKNPNDYLNVNELIVQFLDSCLSAALY